MTTSRTREALILGAFICAGLIVFASLLANTALEIKGMDRIVNVKGLAEREVEADIAIWPITFNEAHNELTQLYSVIEQKSGIIVAFLTGSGFSPDEISISQPSIIDRQAQNYGDARGSEFRFTASTTVTVYTEQINLVRETMKKMVDLGKEGIAISGQDYQNKTEFLFTGLNGIKPEMIEEATKNAREVAEKFAKDSNSRLGKIKTATQGQFSISDRDTSTQHIKKVRVVST
ncbi:MAG: SIMPL domain-containing protein, partial [Desulfofustis sp.]|nr:SIMPL domain-containing protein [Desulfofustis sp.]